VLDISLVALQVPISFLIYTLLLILAVTVLEALFCIVTAMMFRVEELPRYYSWFSSHYKISEKRNAVTYKSCMNNWFLLLSVKIKNTKIKYTPLIQSKHDSAMVGGGILKQSIILFTTNAVSSILNVLRYIVLFVLVPFLFVFSFFSIIERIYRFLLTPLFFILFWLFAKLKILIIYYFCRFAVDVYSYKRNDPCTIRILYNKPIIRIHLKNPQSCPDSLQRDNINHFTATLESILHFRHRIRLKTVVYYPNKRVNMSDELPLTIKYIRATYAKLKYMQSI